MSSNHLEQEAAIHSLSTLMSITPTDTYTEFEKVFFNVNFITLNVNCARVQMIMSADTLFSILST